MSILTEAQFQRQVTDLARMLGFWHVHFRAGRTAHGWAVPVSGPLGAGWPDLFLVRERDRRAIFVELKSATGKLTDDQRRVLGVLSEAGFETYVWRPADLDTAYAVLEGRPPRSPDELPLPARPASGVPDRPGVGAPVPPGPSASPVAAAGRAEPEVLP